MLTFTCSSLISSISAISLYDFPSKSLSCMQLRCFSGRASTICLTRLILSSSIIRSWGLDEARGSATFTSSKESLLFSFFLMRSSERFRHTVRLNASIESMFSHSYLRFQTFISVSWTMSSASALLSVIRSASRKSSFFNGNTSLRKLTFFIFSLFKWRLSMGESYKHGVKNAVI